MAKRAFKEQEDFGNEGVDNISTDFNLEDEYKPAPLIPQAAGYRANVTAMSFDRKSNAIVLEWTLNGNGGFCSDGETPIDGKKLWQRMWLPRPGDEVTMTASGSMTKRQSKINMLKKDLERLKIKANTLAELLELIANSELIGMEGSLEVVLDTWEGTVSNKVGKASAV